MQLLCFLVIFHTLISFTSRADQPMAHNGSNDVVPSKEATFGDRSYNQFHEGAFLPPKIPKIPIGLAGSRKTQERFRVGLYLHEEPTGKHQVYLKPRGLQRKEYCSKGFKFWKKIPQWGNPNRIAYTATQQRIHTLG
jgi:hypothetical protein